MGTQVTGPGSMGVGLHLHAYTYGDDTHRPRVTFIEGYKAW